MPSLAVNLNLPELQALLELSDTELLRRKFIDPKFPGHQSDPEKLELAASAIRSLREAFIVAKGFPTRNTAKEGFAFEPSATCTGNHIDPWS
jgi:hypothetical protein